MKKTWGRLTYDGWEKPALTDAGPSGQTFSCRTSASQSAESRRTTGRSESRTRCSPEVVPGLVEVEVAVPRLIPAVW